MTLNAQQHAGEVMPEGEARMSYEHEVTPLSVILEVIHRIEETHSNHFRVVETKLDSVISNQEKLMTLVDDLKTDLDTIKQDVSDSLAELTAVHQQLTDAIAAGADPAKMQALVDEANGIVAEFPVKATPPAPTAATT